MRILLNNIQDGGRGRLHRIEEVIRSVQPNAVALVEVASAVDARRLAAALEMHSTFGEGNSALHVAWLTKSRPARAENHRRPQFAKTLLEIELDGLRLFAVHATSRHEEAWAPRGPEMRAIVETVAGRADLVVGDLNAIRRGDPIGAPPPGVVPRGEAVPSAERVTLDPLLAAGFVDCFRALHPDEPGWTYTAQHPWLRLDYAFAARQVAPSVVACEVVPAAASDHLPLLVELS